MTTTDDDTPFFKPDRGNRPRGMDNEWGTSQELFTEAELGGQLRDGRPYVLEVAAVDGLTLGLYYFDRRGLEEASANDLLVLMLQSGVQMLPRDPEDEWTHSAEKMEDAQGRPIWELKFIYLAD